MAMFPMPAYTIEDYPSAECGMVPKWTPVAVVEFACGVGGIISYNALCVLPDEKMASIPISKLNFVVTPALKEVMAEATLVKRDGSK